MPGIAGIILTVGMAVDANVLIFERIKEEKKGEKNQSGKGKDKKKQSKKDPEVMDADFEDVTEKKSKKDDGDKKEKSA